DDVGPESRAVFPDLPCLCAKMPFFSRSPQHGREVMNAVGVRIERRSVPADDFALQVAINAFRPFVPGAKPAVVAEQEKSEILYPHRRFAARRVFIRSGVGGSALVTKHENVADRQHIALSGVLDLAGRVDCSCYAQSTGLPPIIEKIVPEFGDDWRRGW